MGDLIGMVAVLGAFAVPIMAIAMHHQRVLAQMRGASGGVHVDSQLLEEIQELKRQIVDMRDTTTRYDMSFDSALQRIESRVGNLETKVKAIEATENDQQVNRVF